MSHEDKRSWAEGHVDLCCEVHCLSVCVCVSGGLQCVWSVSTPHLPAGGAGKLELLKVQSLHGVR